MTNPANEPNDGLLHELIDVVRDNTEKTVGVRSDVNRALGVVYQDIVTIKRQLEAEAKERPQRQKELDGKIEKITRRLDIQDGILERQDQTLDVLFKAGRTRLYLMIGIFLFCGFVALRVAVVWLGWFPWLR